MTRRRRPPPAREVRRQAILAAAIRLSARLGMENVGFGEVARETGLSRPLIYFYFPDLVTLRLEALNQAMLRLHGWLLTTVKPAKTGLAQILAIGHAYVAFARKSPDEFELLAHNESRTPAEQLAHPGHQQCQMYYDSVMGLLVAALQRGLRDGSIRPDIGDPAKVAVCLWGLTHGLIQIATTKLPTLETSLGPAAAHLPEFGLDLIARSLRPLRKTS